MSRFASDIRSVLPERDADGHRPLSAEAAPTEPAARPHPRAAEVLRLQRTIGNRAVGRLLRAGLLASRVRAAAPGVVQRVKTAVELDGLAGTAERAGGTTLEQVRMVLGRVNVGNRIDDVYVGKTIHFMPVGEGDTAKNCHFFAFGGLKGDTENYHIQTLAQRAQATVPYAEWVAQGDNAEMGVSEEMYNAGMAETDFARVNGQVLDVKQWYGLEGAAVNYPVRIYEAAHSARQIGGRWWHKFIDNTFVLAVEGADNLHYGAPTAEVTVRSVAADVGAAGSFTLPAAAVVDGDGGEDGGGGGG